MAIGPWQIAVIVLLLLLVFGASRISEVGKGLGEGIRQFKKGMSGDEPEPKKKRRRDEDEEDEGDDADEEDERPKRLSSRARDRDEGTRERRHVRPKRPKARRDEE